jgi:RNA polymerase sigma-70 factor (ECF subfamily)
VTLAQPDENETADTIAERTSSRQAITDAELVAGAQRDESWAVEQLIRRYQPKAFAIAYRMSSGDEEQARDLTQEAFLNAIRSIKKFKGRSGFYTWFYRIVVNTCLDARRKGQRWRQIFTGNRRRDPNRSTMHQDLEAHSDLHPSADPMSNLSGKQLQGEIKNALAQLSQHQRMAFTLKVFEGLSIAEIAQAMQTAEGTVKSHLFRATQHMRQALGDWAPTA